MYCMKRLAAFLSVILFFSFSSCKKNSGANTNGNTNTDSSNPAYDLVMGSLTVIPFDTADVTALVPLGNLNPPGHVFPTDHMYFYCFTNKASLDIKSPGNLHIVQLVRTHYNIGAVGDHYDYTIMLGSDNSFMYWYHVSNLSQRLFAAVNNFNSVTCDSVYSTGGNTYQQCRATVSLSATAGEVLGFAIATNGLAGMDLGVTVKNIGANPLDYFNAASRAMLEPKLGRFDGKVKRTVAPIYGEFLLDIAGAAKGNWFKNSTQKGVEDNDIALVNDNITPAQLAFSIGNSVPGLSSNVYYFDTQNTGLVNRDFKDLTADGNTYCYSLGYANPGFIGSTPFPGISLLVKLENANSLSVEKRNCDCTCTPYVFTSNKSAYIR